MGYGMLTGQKKEQRNKKCFTAKSLKTKWNKNILFLFHCQITENWVKQKHLFLFHCQINDNWVKQKERFLFLGVNHWKWAKEKLFSFCFRNIVKICGETKHIDEAWSVSKMKEKFFFFTFLFTFTKVKTYRFQKFLSGFRFSGLVLQPIS